MMKKNPRVYFGIFIFSFFLLIVMLKLFSLNELKSDKIFTKEIPALRGNIFDCNNQILATSYPYYVAYLDVEFLKKYFQPSYEIDLKILAKNFNLKINFKQKFIKLGEAFDKEILQNKIPPDLLPFVSFNILEKRNSIKNFGFENIIGIYRDGKGISGVEKYFDSYLDNKSNGKIKIKYSGFFTSNATISSYIPPKNGNSIKLTIDSRFQTALYDLALFEKEKYSADAVGIIVMETNTGKIKSLITTRNWPDFIMGYIEPGSAIKPVFYAAALDLGVITDDATFICNGYIKPDPSLDIKISDIHTHGLIDFYDAIAKSCNVAAVKTAKLLVDDYDTKKLYEIFKTFGFGEKTGIELPGEIKGILKKSEEWSKIDWAYLPIGYSIGVTPLQLISAFNSVVNNGIYVSPTIIENSKPKTYRVITLKTSQILKKALKKVVENGTGILAKIPNLTIYGKTGTAEKKPGTNEYIMTFEGFFEYKKQKFTILVWVDNPKGYELSSFVSAPIFKDVVKTIVDIINKKKKKAEVITPGVVPNLLGWNLYQLGKIDKVFDIKIKGVGLYVIDQNPTPNTISNEIQVTLGF
ncbi:peptidoglycan D,D-transpeptidase FtsI family protein [Thermosipho atlanticus]|uniref:Cell division protein FtsI (Penicillin-binding protein 3) n=1 Tax=Thermosipho atlanticus DSM 15807 TaxID=1123380 RepID=A0A1M5SS30_9BACT|nr:penicillin-binding protein 2 [Thermosipho atlanticus]SHH41292.1 cell division protein FtsI (penicillin-binding protein 3) [Thermosipho atlanticus DSM 15807]